MRRFGRNQKRALRERIANLEDGLARSSNKTSYISKTYYELVKQFLFIEREIDANSVLLPANTLGTDQETYPPKKPFPERSHVNFDFGIGTELRSYNVQTKFMVNAYISERQNIFDNQVHYLLDFGGNRFGYSISEDALASMSKEGLCQRLAENFAIMITNHIKNEPTAKTKRH
jgi:hypothetical protein